MPVARRQWLADWAVPNLGVNKLGGTTGEWDWATQDSSVENKASKPLTEEICRGCEGGFLETPSLTEEFIGEAQRILECTQTWETRPERAHYVCGKWGKWQKVGLEQSKQLSADFPNLAGKKGLKRSIWSHERQRPTSHISVSRKAII